MRVVLDTNVLVSGLLYPGGAPSRLLEAWRGAAYTLVLSEFLIDELAITWRRLGPRLRAPPPDLDDFLDFLRLSSELVAIGADDIAQALATGIRDPQDAPILALLTVSAADMLVTGDKDLLALAADFPILTPADFCARHGL